MKRVLIVSPHFPPTNAPDMQRVRMSLPYYRQFGWEPEVLAIDPAEVDSVQEPELLATVPSDVPVIRCRAWSRRVTRWLGIGTLGYRALRPLGAAGAARLAQRHYDLVFCSNTQFLTFLLGRRWRARFGVPYVLDVQDPWRTDYYQRPGARKPPGGWKYQFARVQAALLEGWTFRKASGVMSVSPAYLEALRQRYPELANVPSDVIRFGASRADLDAARAQATATDQFQRRSGEVHFVYTGAAGPITPDATRILFEALRTYRQRAPERAARLRWHFYGTSYVAPGSGRTTIIPLAEAAGVADLVDEVPHRLGHLECLRLQSEADVLLLPGSSDLAYSPSKTYPYYLTGRPILGLVFRGSVLEQLLDELRCAFLVRIAQNEANDQARLDLMRFFDAALESNVASLLTGRNDAYFNAHFLAEELTRRQCALFDRAVVHAAER